MKPSYFCRFCHIRYINIPDMFLHILRDVPLKPIFVIMSPLFLCDLKKILHILKPWLCLNTHESDIHIKVAGGGKKSICYEQVAMKTDAKYSWRIDFFDL